jgi:hypothetical protein
MLFSIDWMQMLSKLLHEKLYNKKKYFRASGLELLDDFFAIQRPRFHM